MSPILRWIESVRHLRASQAGHRLVRALSGEPRPARRPAGHRSPAPPSAPLAPLPPVSRRPLADPYDRPEAGGWRIAGMLAHPGGADGMPRFEGEPTPLAVERAMAAGPVRALAEAGDLDGARSWMDSLGRSRGTPHLRALRALALLEARAHGLTDADAVLLEDLPVLAHRPPWDERGLALACVGAALHRGGAAFSGAVARGWRARGASILSTCAADQVLADGVHVERSPVRHALFLELLLAALSTSESLGEAPPRGVRRTAARLATVLPTLVLPDGELLRSRGGTPGEALPLRSLLAWAELHVGAVPTPAATCARVFPAAGCAILATPDGRSAATFWVAPPSPPDRPLDRHADALSVEVVLDGVRVIASAGTTSGRDAAGARLDRQAGAFAGLRVDDVPTCAPGGGPRGWARRLVTKVEPSGVHAEAYAGGLAGAATGVVLRRVVFLGAAAVVVVIDEATGGGTHDLAWAWPLAPGLSAHVAGDRAVIEGLGRTFTFLAPGLSLTVEEGLAARGPGVGVRREVLWSRARRALPTRVVHAIAGGGGPLRLAVTPVPGGELRVEAEGACGRVNGIVPMGRRP